MPVGQGPPEAVVCDGGVRGRRRRGGVAARRRPNGGGVSLCPAGGCWFRAAGGVTTSSPGDVVDLLVKRVALVGRWGLVVGWWGVAPSSASIRAPLRPPAAPGCAVGREARAEVAIFCGVDWSEHHHDVAIIDDQGAVLARRRITDDAAGLTMLTGLLAEHGPGGEFVPVDIALETDRGLLVAALRAAGHRVFAINPKAVDRYRSLRGVRGEVRSR